ncbi:hypothetical protein PCC7424_1856 [Gloeothece citriformis PCC 7424]|uniref:Uncharacterized protein n=1 Tax=Gloeothece citriformis (strain PCC 7424) TaxID=65393 RepID=B7KCI3_GLOC7|nr:hypothetical protein PCC7424_1856 [Gloeothece citriformis PCC 7424]
MRRGRILQLARFIVSLKFRELALDLIDLSQIYLGIFPFAYLKIRSLR